MNFIVKVKFMWLLSLIFVFFLSYLHSLASHKSRVNRWGTVARLGFLGPLLGSGAGGEERWILEQEFLDTKMKVKSFQISLIFVS